MRFIILLILGLLCPIGLHADQFTSTTDLKSILQKINPEVSLGMIVANADTGTVLYSQNADRLFSPASVQKVFTAVAALNFLGSNYHFVTKVLAQGDIKNHELQGNLIIKFSGDPELTTHDLAELINTLKQHRIQKITGHVYLDNSDYAPIPYPPGRMWDDLSYGYAAPVNAIIIDRNAFVLNLIPGAKNHALPRLHPLLPDGVVNLVNQMKTILHPSELCPVTIYSDIYNHYRLNGCIHRASGQQTRILAIRDPDLYAKVLIAQLLKSNGVEYNTPVQIRSVTSQSTKILAQHESPPLHTLIRKMLKNSDNITTDSLLEKMGQLYYRKQGTWQNGLKALKTILEPTDIDFTQNLINDGAGLSRYNLVTPRQLIQLLRYAYQEPRIRTPLWNALPIGGKDGTLIGRMRQAAKGERIHAKTGTMTGVSALAGYLKSQNHGTLVFAIMINGIVGKDRPYRRIQDRICEHFIHNY